MLVIGAFICILKSTPAADVVDQDRREIRGTGLDLRHQFLKSLATVEPKPAPTRSPQRPE